MVPASSLVLVLLLRHTLAIPCATPATTADQFSSLVRGGRCAESGQIKTSDGDCVFKVSAARDAKHCYSHTLPSAISQDNVSAARSAMPLLFSHALLARRTSPSACSTPPTSALARGQCLYAWRQAQSL